MAGALRDLLNKSYHRDHRRPALNWGLARHVYGFSEAEMYAEAEADGLVVVYDGINHRWLVDGGVLRVRRLDEGWLLDGGLDLDQYIPI